MIFGEHLDGTPLEDPNARKNPAAVALGKLGGAKGSTARALSPARTESDCEESCAGTLATPNKIEE